jgi:dihydroorotase
MVATALTSPLTMIASDSYWQNGAGHPRTTGTYSRVLGLYVRERKSLSLMEALRKMTLIPAQRLEARVPAMKQKGRLQVGADADITIFDAARVLDRSTYREPTLAPVGIQEVIVNGVVGGCEWAGGRGRRTRKACPGPTQCNACMTCA